MYREPPIVDIVEEIHRHRRRFAEMTATLRNRDISGALNRTCVRPDLTFLMITALGGHLPGLEDEAIASDSAWPFSCAAAPPRFHLFGTEIQALHESYGVGDIGWSGSGRFPHSFTPMEPSG